MNNRGITLDKLPIELLTKIHEFIENPELKPKLHQVNSDLYNNFESRYFIMTNENTQKRVCKIPEKTYELEIRPNINCEGIKLNSQLRHLIISDGVSPKLFDGMILPNRLYYYNNSTEHKYLIFFPKNVNLIRSKTLYSHRLFDQQFFISPPSLKVLEYFKRENEEKLSLILSDNLVSLNIQNPVEIITSDKFIDKIYSGETVTENDLMEANKVSNRRLPKSLRYLAYIVDVDNLEILKDIIQLSKDDELISVYYTTEVSSDISLGNFKLGKNVQYFNLTLSNAESSVVQLNDEIIEFSFWQGIIKNKLPNTLKKLTAKQLVNTTSLSNSLKFLFVDEFNSDIILNDNLDLFWTNYLSKGVRINFNDNLKFLNIGLTHSDEKLNIPKSLRVLIVVDRKINIGDLHEGIQFLKLSSESKDYKIPDTVRVLVGEYSQTHFTGGKLPRDIKVITDLPEYIDDRTNIEEGFITINDKKIYYDKDRNLISHLSSKIQEYFQDDSLSELGNKKVVVENIVEIDLD